MTRRLVGFALFLACASPAPGPSATPGDVLPDGNADYTWSAELDPATREITGRGEVRWTNPTAVPTAELRFHLYWNAWSHDRTTWMLGNRREGGGDRREGDWGWIEVNSLRLEGADLKPAARYDSPDDGNALDRTVLVVPLPAPVGPGETVTVAVEFKAKVPRTFARTGARGDYFFVAHWFPKLGVFEGEKGWNCRQFHAITEFFGDYGDYDVALTLPANFVVGATGREVETTASGGKTTHRFTQAAVHGFTWTASPDFRVATDRFTAPDLPPVELRLLYQPEHEAQVKRHFDATKAALDRYGRWFGAYPYGHVTIVDPAWESGSGGMEYPTLFTSGTSRFSAFGGGSPEGVTIHEAGHQFWYGLVGNNEIEHAWLDEGLNTFSTERTAVDVYGPDGLTERYLRAPGARWRAFLPYLFEGLVTNRVEMSGMGRYRTNGMKDIPATPTFQYDPRSAATISYSKTALWLLTLERYLGWEEGLQPVLARFFAAGRFRHPEPAELFALADEVARARTGEDLGWFWAQVHHGSAMFDYGIDRATSVPADPEGWVEKDGQRTFTERKRGKDAKNYRTEVVVRRHGDGFFPVDVLLTFEDGSTERTRWDGRGRWKALVYERASKLARVVVDPDEVLALDVNRTNNSHLMEGDAVLPAAKWASKWMIWLQDRLAAFAFFG